MTDEQALAYVAASAALMAIPLDGDRARRVATHLQRTAAMAALLDAVALGPHDEPVALYCPTAQPPAKREPT